ncbi:hypothetical protein LTR95_011957 [Oleoguttula sp. CCFEE 5521]
MSSSRSASTDSSQSTLTGASGTKETRRDSAYAAMPARSTLEIWRSEQNTSAAFAAQAYRFASGPDSVPKYCASALTDARSVAKLFDARLAMESGDMGTISESPIESLEADLAVQEGGLDDEGQVIDYGLVPSQVSAGIKCLFDFLGCDKVSQSLARWNEHSKTHFKSHSPPTEMKCPVRECAQTFQADDGEVTWSNRWSHIQISHDLEEMAERSSSLDVAMVQHLYNKGIVDRADVKELRTHGRLRADKASVVSSQSESRHRRREGGEPRSGRARR